LGGGGGGGGAPPGAGPPRFSCSTPRTPRLLAFGRQPGVPLIMSLMYSLPVNTNVYPGCDYSLPVSHVQEAVVSYRQSPQPYCLYYYVYHYRPHPRPNSNAYVILHLS
jgi:hypothetical protein